MIDKSIIGKLENLLVVETSQGEELKVVLLPKGTIIDFKISSDFDHYVSKEEYDEVTKYIDDNKLNLENVYYSD